MDSSPKPNQLIEVIVGGARPATVIFYDGANEVLAKCSRGNDFFSHYSEKRIHDALTLEPADIGYYLQPIKAAAKFAATTIFGQDAEKKKAYDCDTDTHKADLVAEALVTDWTIAKYIAESNGARFYAFLQPMAFLSKTRLAGPLDGEQGQQYQAVYPLIRAKMKLRGIGIDLSGILDRDDYYYVDFCHLSPNGNRLVAEAIRKTVTTPTSD